MSQELMMAVRQHRVEKGSAVLWWLGQNGFFIRSPRGVTILVDAYLTNWCQTRYGEPMGLNLNRRVPVFIEPEELDVDFFLCTHSHDDHADPETIRRLNPERVAQFGGPGLTCEVFERRGIPRARIHQIYAGGRLQADDVTVLGTFALPTDDTDLDHLGFFFAIEDGPRIYMTGDTDYSTLLEYVGKLEPDLMITCINGGFNNLSHWEAAEVARAVKPAIAIPCHYDMFPDNSVDPAQFRASLRIKAPDVQYQQLDYVKPFVLRG
jgi:L-ascorbate 6-phosphate lactonase